jgi:hypothetical protein
MAIEIEKDVPLPEGYSRTVKYPFAAMEVGDSFFEEGKTSDQLTNSAAHWRKKNCWKFTARNVDGGARIWRVK